MEALSKRLLPTLDVDFLQGEDFKSALSCLVSRVFSLGLAGVGGGWRGWCICESVGCVFGVVYRPRTIDPSHA